MEGGGGAGADLGTKKRVGKKKVDDLDSCPPLQNKNRSVPGRAGCEKNLPWAAGDLWVNHERGRIKKTFS